MRIQIPCTALGLALAAATSAAHAQTVIAPQPLVAAPAPVAVVTQPVQTVQTVTTVRTIAPRSHRRVDRRVVVTRRTYVTRSVVPAVTAVAPVAAAPAPLYDYDYDYDYGARVPAPVAAAPRYDTAVETLAPLAPPAVGSAVPFYRYVYQSDRILVVDPNTGIAVEALPR